MLWKDQIREWKDEAREDGLAEGARTKAIETAKNMLENKLSTDLIAECTGLSLEEVLNLKNNKA